MIAVRVRRALDAVEAGVCLMQVEWLFRRRGRRAVALETARAMRTLPSPQAVVDARGIDAWQTGRAVWRAARRLPFRSSCLKTALATRKLFERKGIRAAVRVGVRESGEAHAWVEVGDFILDDQKLVGQFEAFAPPAVEPGGAAR